MKTKILIAGVGGASLGTEIIKCLQLAGSYSVCVCDINPKAYGNFMQDVIPFQVSRFKYVEDVLNICKDAGISYIIPGGTQPLVLLNEAISLFKKEGISIVGNNSAVISLCDDKLACANRLKQLGYRIPYTTTLVDGSDPLLSYPCVVKPTTGTGGSLMVFVARNQFELRLYADMITQSGRLPIAQEYVSDKEGEFTVGVLMLPSGAKVGSVAMKRDLSSKLSCMYRENGVCISSGYSQGLIDRFDLTRFQCESMAESLKSTGPLNIQGRFVDGELVVFEINPRFSASTYLRALAGFNEIDITLRYMIRQELVSPEPLRAGHYLRSFTETYIPK